MKYSRVKERLVKQRKLNVDILKCQHWDYLSHLCPTKLDLILTRPLSFLNGLFYHGDEEPKRRIKTERKSAVLSFLHLVAREYDHPT